MATTSSSTGHIRKRPFQPSVTSYFNTRDTNTNTFPSIYRNASPLSPPLPAETQASLLSVGMRVRKSVPEGYKTHKTLGTDGFPFPSTAPPRARTDSQRSYDSTSPRELTPFCGLHKTGGWAAQGVPASSAPAVLARDEEDEDDVPGMTMSQNTLSSTQDSFVSAASTQPGANKKRTYEDEIEDEMDAYFDQVEAVEMDEQLPQSIRPRARMKGTKKITPYGSEVHIAGEDDFEEAAFLAPLDGMELDGM
ncbi:hypothetical protein LTR37_000442 [Vermiconidia calcicola]|uniref:Uncharacterized protein n=1 Tax=Vermiconidia calcicola TaxID=1690605 RepID=A0ACC3NZF4_9PEZI|nr:hypothetical protein LTR37_000442 [Vermiconidia calcicola]